MASSSDPNRQSEIRAFEEEAEVLAAYQLDLLAQLERQLRAVHHTMRRIERLRSPDHRVGPELSNGQRLATLRDLSDEIADLESHIKIEHECCDEMLATIAQMRERITHLRTRASRVPQASGSQDSSDSNA
jgi:chromosome segregation ATPase